MGIKQVVEQFLFSWDRHNEILLYLLDKIPEEGLKAVPSGSRGRDVAAQFYHLDRVRRGWVHYHRHGERPKLDRYDKQNPPSKAELEKLLKASSAEVLKILEDGLNGELKPRLFGGNIIRWYSYLVAHESHHRGAIMLALKQNNLKLPDTIAVDGLWGKWIYGKD